MIEPVWIETRPMRALRFLFPAFALTATAGLSGCLTTGGMLAPSTPPGVAALDGGAIARSQTGGRLPSQVVASAVAAEYQALQFGTAGQAVTWSADGYSGRVVPTQLYRVGSQDCRGYTQYVDGADTNGITGTACRGEDGFWVPVA
ncbi:MAG: hypothetical protein VYD57_14255 [Pseudomonadota bacterium]|nr:hypothetical protein [Pseudomonadota bacterium]